MRILVFMLLLVVLSLGCIQNDSSAKSDCMETPEEWVEDNVNSDSLTKPDDGGHKLCKSLEDCSDLSKNEWNKKIKWRSLHVKHNDQLEYLRDFYPKKIQRILNHLNESLEMLDGERLMCEAKILRLKDKYATTLKEIEFRETKTFDRDPIGTTYYIDYVNGNDSHAGTATGTAWKTINKYTTTTSRTPGDVAYLRANQVHNETSTDIVFDENGNLTDYIELRGASSTDDPWSDGSDVKPIVSFCATTNTFYIYQDDFWKFKDFEIINSSDTSYEMIRSGYCKGLVFDGCVIRDTVSAGVIGFKVYASEITIMNSEFYNNQVHSIEMAESGIKLINCNFTGGSATTDYGVYLWSGNIHIRNTSFGLESAHDVADIYFYRGGGRIHAINSKFNNPSGHVYATNYFVKSENHNQTYNTSRIWYPQGEVEQEPTVVRSGGASSSAKLTPNSNCGVNFPMSIIESHTTGDFKVWTTAIETNITVYMRGYGWTTFPTATSLYTETSYLNTGTSAGRATISSNEVLADNTNWVGFDTIFTPSQDGWAYVTVYLGAYQANSGIYCDIKPVVS